MATKTKQPAVSSQTEPMTVEPTRSAIPKLYWLVVILMLTFGFGLRCYHITDPGMDIHPQRQYWDAHRARLLYFKLIHHNVSAQNMAIASQNAQSGTEPPVMESLAAASYCLLGGENVTVPRVLSALFFVISGLFLFLLAVRLFTPLAAIVALGYYLFLPFGVQATRTFQPDPLMTALVTVSLFLYYRYYEQPTLKRLLMALPTTAFAIYVKPMGIFVLLGVFLALGLKRVWEYSGATRRRTLSQVLFHPHMLIFGTAVLAGAAIYLYAALFPAKSGIEIGGQANKTFMPALFLNPGYYVEVLKMLGQNTVRLWALIAGLLGLIVCSEKGPRRLLIGGWIGMVAYAFIFNYHVMTHSYYSLLLLPVLALSLGALVAAALPALLPEEAPASTRRLVLGLFGVVIVLSIWLTGKKIATPEPFYMVKQYKDLVAIDQEIGDIVGHSQNTVLLTYDYGDAEKYYGMFCGTWWPTSADFGADLIRNNPQQVTLQRLSEKIRNGAEYFIITNMQEFYNQTDLQRLLTGNFPLVANRPGYIIFDLRHPLAQRPASPGQ